EGSALMKNPLLVGRIVEAVAARKGSDLAWAELTGYLPHRIAADEGGSTLTALTASRVIFNTVPHWLFTRDVMECLRQDVLLIDLASAPGGIDPQAAEEIGMRVIRAPGLPGKCAPETAGEITADTVIDIVAREGVVRT
ncbi:MAG: dipicolinate synthase subunit DpsA, partial [Clostridia bacterium]|nr:dipicolinate synthase subunit DpsA [Clostridia bacterium]